MRTGKYQPSNGTEGTYFIEEHCMRCVFCDPDPQGERQCEILALTMVFNVKDEEYPKEWVYKEGVPTCTKHKRHDWENDGVPELPIDDPNQTKLF